VPGMKNTMHEYKTGALHSGSKKGPVVRSRAQAIAIGLSEDRQMGKKASAKKAGKKPHNSRADMGMAGEAATRDEQPMTPPYEMDTSRQPHPMPNNEMYQMASPNKQLHSDIEHHMKQASMHSGKGSEHQAMREHHEGMARALRAQLHPQYHKGPEYP
jgi:hypothetical protein